MKLKLKQKIKKITPNLLGAKLRAKQKESKKNLTLLEVLKRIVAYRRATKYKENGTRTLF